MSSRRPAPLIAQMLMAALLFGSMPIAASPTIGAIDAAPAITLDICHPQPSFAINLASCTLAPLAAYSFAVTIENRPFAEAPSAATSDRDGDAPDPHPPQSLA